MFIFSNVENTRVPKFRNRERTEIQNIVANLTIKRIPDSLIIKHIFHETGFSLLLIPILGVILVFSISISNLYALTNVNSSEFSMNITDNWTYQQGSSGIGLTPNDFGVILLNQTKPLSEKMQEKGAYSSFEKDLHYPIKNAGLDLYAKYKIDKQDGMKVITQENVTIDNEPAVKISADGIGPFNGTKFIEYMIMHNKEPYNIAYMANVKDYDKYLPEFEQIVKTFRFVK